MILWLLIFRYWKILLNFLRRFRSYTRRFIKAKFFYLTLSCIYSFVICQHEYFWERTRNYKEYFVEIRSRSVRYTRKRVIWHWSLSSRCSLHPRMTCDLRESPREFHLDLIRDFTVEKKGNDGNGKSIPGTITAAVVSWPVSFDTVLNPIRATSRSLLFFFFFFFCFLSLPLCISVLLFRSFKPRVFVSGRSFPSGEQTAWKQ